MAETIFEFNAKTRREGDDLAIYFYGFGWIFFGISFIFTQDVFFIDAMNFYVFFDVLALIFIFTYFYQKDEHKFDFPDPKPFVGSLILVLLGMVAIYFIGLFLSLLFPYGIEAQGEMFEGNVLQYILFQVFRSIPVEELAFRGLAIDLFVIPLTKFSNMLQKSEVVQESEGLQKFFENSSRKLIWAIAIIITSLFFGFYHIFRYDRWDAVIYLFLLGIILGFLRYTYGIFSSILLHVANNLIFAGGLFFFLIV